MIHVRTKSGPNPLFIIALIILTLAAFGLAGYAGWQLWLRHQATNEPNPTISTEIVTHSTETPSETMPTEACAAYTVPDLRPKRITLPSLNVEGCIEQVGIDQHGAVAVPTNIHVAGWYTGSATPGNTGLSIIDGHINGNYTSDGIFQHLDTLKPEDTFSITRGDDMVLQYEVVSVTSIPIDEASKELFTQKDDISSQLNLITCGGRWNKDIQQFDHRIVVVSKLTSDS